MAKPRVCKCGEPIALHRLGDFLEHQGNDPKLVETAKTAFRDTVQELLKGIHDRQQRARG